MSTLPAQLHSALPPSAQLPQSLSLRAYGGDELALARRNLGHAEIPSAGFWLRPPAAALGHGTEDLQLGFQRRPPLTPTFHRHHHPVHFELLLLLEGEDYCELQPSPAGLLVGVDLPLPAHGSEPFRVAPRHAWSFSDGGAADDLAVGAEDNAAAHVFAVAGGSIELGATWDVNRMGDRVDRGKEELVLTAESAYCCVVVRSFACYLSGASCASFLFFL